MKLSYCPAQAEKIWCVRETVSDCSIYDLVVVAAAQAAQERGMCIPDDNAIVGFDGLFSSLTTTPLITTDQQLLPDKGKIAHKYVAVGWPCTIA